LLVMHDVKVAAKTEQGLFMFDGRIAGEYSMGRYTDASDGFKARKERLTSWLADMKF
jgi:hypothetical protein